ncbi:hypothetical protein N7456_000508 [Penicillium angulare]|uniref:Palmitoyl-protein thioesterase 1 n=1 Tax=Penicillium angulare TaxID=116970 RepID=A0A9W9GCL2_9EURO|nr:hypothetical protein N7456_000508 [Penicillium angulare]
MMLHLLPLISLATGTISLRITPKSTTDTTQLPLVIWHGLGDDFERDGLNNVANLAEKINPNTHVHIIHLSDTGSGDRQATFFGNVSDQLDSVCAQLSTDPILQSAPAINALGFSQGGQFLRGYIERCNNPPVHNLITFGSQHNGISEFQQCEIGDWFCSAAESILRSGTWVDFVQSHVVPAQYFRDMNELEPYLEHSNFLADINNERAVKNGAYKRRLESLNLFVMYMFGNDSVAVPKETAHFADVNSTDGAVTGLKDRRIYKEDWIGLRSLDERDRLDFRTVPGQHMEISREELEGAFREFFGPTRNDLIVANAAAAAAASSVQLEWVEDEEVKSPGLVVQPGSL